jgi:hypothetical protein
VDRSKAIITSAGAYSISGSLVDGQIVVDTNDEDAVRLILNGADISSSTSSPIYVDDAEKEVIILEGAEKRVSDGESYVLDDPESDEPNAAIFSKAYLILSKNGSLAVEGNYKDGIASKDGLTIAGGTITVKSVDDGIRGKDFVIVEDGAVTVEAQGGRPQRSGLIGRLVSVTRGLVVTVAESELRSAG